MIPSIVFVLCAIFVLILTIIAVYNNARVRKEMIAKGYTWEFVINCSADPGSWQWVLRR